uniref:DUF5641 domain-containing protein n=1 Tax=Strigamia maritima TaxID=126957 RepID=T1IYK6_STRMM
MTKFLDQGSIIDKSVQRFLFAYRSTPHATTAKTPAEEFTNRVLRTRLHLLNPIPSSDLVNTKRNFEVEDAVYVRDYRSQTRWIPGVILRRVSSTTYTVQIANAIVWNRHVDQLRSRQASKTSAKRGGDFLDIDSAPSPFSQDDSQQATTAPVANPMVLPEMPSAVTAPNPDPLRPPENEPSTAAQTTAPAPIPQRGRTVNRDIVPRASRTHRSCGPPQKFAYYSLY